ncbi:MAG: shikimate kinase [Planctomycetales bacterium]|nr:shikimate kinase [Planctomycetales bacterium]
MRSSSTIALIGYRGTGKTTVARLLASRLGFDWVDADVEVERKAGKSIAAIFAESGESAFRDLEASIVARLCGQEQLVIALGGGAVLREENRKCLASCRQVVWLKASPEVIAERLEHDPTTAARRPNLTNHGGRNEIEQLLDQRTPIYRACATLEVDTEDRDPADIADDIVRAISG